MTRSLLLMPLHRPIRHLGVEVGQDTGGVLADRPRQRDDWPQAGPRRPRQPLVEEIGRLVRRGLLQDDRQVLLQPIGAVESTILSAQRLQAPLLAGLQTRGVFQQAEARPLERLGRLRAHPPLLRPPDLVHRVRGEAFNVNRSKTTRACGTRARNAFCQLAARSTVTRAIPSQPDGPSRLKNPSSVSALRPLPAHTTRRVSWSTTTVR